MLTLGIETSCDETSVALVEDGATILSNVVSSQVDLHRPYGGVVPEMAARHHLERLPAVMDEALGVAGRTLAEVDLLAVTRGPGLVGALLVGVGFARGLAAATGLPLVGVSHLDGHVHSAFLEAPEARRPALVLLVSGGHTELVLLGRDGGYAVLGRTLDDAAGEAFDKVARLLGLAYPGGPEIDRLAAGVDPAQALRRFPLPAIRVDGLDFSFSGIKSAVRYALDPPRRAGRDDRPGPGPSARGREAGAGPSAGRPRQRPGQPAPAPPDRDPELVRAAAAAFQHRAVEHLVDRLERAARQHRPATLAIAGGVARNRALRETAARRLAGLAPLVVPAAALCTDNAAMIAAAGHHLYRSRPPESLSVEVDPGLGLSA
ncbi:MAG TPA: tRNA (adenosine(37)-N6)-threonylcarbamoyltransferase complex transferase subunit TsaD [Candidatus Dormibacteraeota bacterium]|nr:tRNA (adenosine(37)-N6)-threonylcarbamoyltransferase complex transferase subunit TsaD [Candidatus Dormibacteraeota bacterium]